MFRLTVVNSNILLKLKKIYLLLICEGNMDSIFKDKMSKKERFLYDFMWGSKRELLDIIEPNTRRVNAPTTYRFKGNVGKDGELLKDIFDLDEKCFAPLFERACSGDGNELKKITTLHSSSLCSLLFFHNVSKDEPFVLNVEGRDICFDWVTFEFKNPVIGTASNMDSVMVSDDKKHVLFLESKFSEYYLSASNKSGGISVNYTKETVYSHPLYKSDVLDAMDIEMEEKDLPSKSTQGVIRKGFILKSKNEVYLDGIKQMISHYVGIRRRIDGDTDSGDKKYPNASVVIDAIKNGAKVYYLVHRKGMRLILK